MGDFDIKVWGWKFAKGLGVTLAATGCIYTAEYLKATNFPPEYAFWGGLLVVVLGQIGNWIKHTYLIE